MNSRAASLRALDRFLVTLPSIWLVEQGGAAHYLEIEYLRRRDY